MRLASPHRLTPSHVLSQLNLCGNELGPEGAKALAPALVAVRASLTTVWSQAQTLSTFLLLSLSIVCPLAQLDLSDNYLTDCGKDMTGVTAIAEALKLNASLVTVLSPQPMRAHALYASRPFASTCTLTCVSFRS